MRTHLVSGLGAGFVLITAVACGGNGATTAPAVSAPGPTTAPAASQAGSGAGTCAPGIATGQQVAIANFAFTPPSSTATSGSTITWTNGDSATHTVTFDNGPDCGTVPQGQSTTMTFGAPGTYAYHCKIHPSMKGSVTVS